jgi:hypothetical protein
MSDASSLVLTVIPSLAAVGMGISPVFGSWCLKLEFSLNIGV